MMRRFISTSASALAPAIFMVALSIGPASPAHAETSVEKKLESALLLQFARYIEWKSPEMTALDSFVIAVADDSELQNQVSDSASTKKIKGKRIEVDAMSGEKPKRKSHMVVVSRDKSAAEKSIKALAGCGCLIVSFGDGLASKGAAINFVRNGGSIAFEASQKNARAEQLEISPDLAKAGKSVD